MIEEHGTPSAYRRGCRCEECHSAFRMYQNMYNRMGRVYTTPSEPVRRHLLKLAEHGVGSRAVARLTGLSCSTVRAVRVGRYGRVRRRTASLIMDITPDDRVAGHRIDKARAEKLVNNLVEHGVEKQEIAARLGYKRPNLSLMVTRQQQITFRTWQRLWTAAQSFVNDGRVPASVLEV